MGANTHTIQIYKDVQAWHEARKTSIGASEVASVLGLSPFQTPLQLYLRKRGELDPMPETPRMRIGRAVEPALAMLYQHETGRRLKPAVPFGIYRHVDYPWLHATPDRIISRADGDGILELKSTSEYRRKSWDEDGVPPQYVVQVQAQLICCPFGWASLAALFGTSDWGWWDYAPDATLRDWILDETQRFAERLRTGDPPPASAPDYEMLRRMFPHHVPGHAIELSDDDMTLVTERMRLHAERRQLETAIQTLDAQIIARLREAERGILPDGRMVTYRTYHRRAYEVPAQDIRMLRYPQQRKGLNNEQ